MTRERHCGLETKGRGGEQNRDVLYNAEVTDAIKEVEKPYLLQKLKKAPEGVSA
jgi:hypothetical protein